MISQTRTDSSRERSARRPAARWAVLVTASLLLLCIGWALATPVAAGPDESGHIMKAAATVRGDLAGTPTSKPGIRSFLLPADIGGFAGAVTCYVGNQNQTATCAPALGSLASTVVRVESGVAGYNPVYYLLVGWPSLFLHGGKMVLAMRILNALLVAGLWSVALVVLSFRRPRTAFFVCLAMTPFAVYLGGVVNPSGAEIAAAAAVLVLIDAVSTGRGRGSAWLPVALGIALGLLISLRSISPIFAATAVVAIIGMRGWRPLWSGLRRRAILVMAIVLVPVAVFAVGWTLRVAQPAGFIPSSDPHRPGRLEAFFHTLEQFPGQLTEMIGVMGWFDAWPPAAVHVVWAALIAGAVLLSVLLARPRHALVVLSSGALLLLTPAVLQAVYAPQFGYIWQGRYSLPLLAILLIIAAIAVEEAHPVMASGRFTALAIALLMLQVWAFVAVLKRYAVGADAPWSLWPTNAAWQPPGGAVFVIAVFVLGVGLMMAALIRNSRRPTNLTPPTG